MAGLKKKERTEFDEEAARMEVQASLSKYQDDDAIIVHLGFAPNNLVNDPRLHENYLTVFACDASHIKTKEGGNVFDCVLKDANGQVLNPNPTPFASLDSHFHTGIGPNPNPQTLNPAAPRQALARRKTLNPQPQTLNSKP